MDYVFVTEYVVVDVVHSPDIPLECLNSSMCVVDELLIVCSAENLSFLSEKSPKPIYGGEHLFLATFSDHAHKSFPP